MMVKRCLLLSGRGIDPAACLDDFFLAGFAVTPLYTDFGEGATILIDDSLHHEELQ
jgi:hypothetical protein